MSAVRKYGPKPVPVRHLQVVEEPKEEPRASRRRRCPRCDAPAAVAAGSPRETVCGSCDVQEVLPL